MTYKDHINHIKIFQFDLVYIKMEVPVDEVFALFKISSGRKIFSKDFEIHFLHLR